MTLSNDKLQCVPLVQGTSAEQRQQVAEAFERVELSAGTPLFNAGQPACAMYILEHGQVVLTEADNAQITLNPPAAIGELGALAGLVRNASAVATTTATVWRASRDAILALMEREPRLGVLFYQNLARVVADKIRRDQVRLSDMRSNIIRTQKEMKRLRDFLLESEDTPVSERIHDSLQNLIRDNRRANYRVAPPETLPAAIRLKGQSEVPIVEISRTHISFRMPNGSISQGGRITGVVSLAGPELPVSGQVLRTIDGRVDVKLDLLIDEYIGTLEGYLSRVQMVDCFA